MTIIIFGDKIRNRNKCCRTRKQKKLPYWNEHCRHAIYARNRARNKMIRNRTAENIESYRKLKGIAQKTIKTAASDYWHTFCGTLHRTTKLSTVWSMAKRMNGVSTSGKPHILLHENEIIESDRDKANLFVKNFSKVSSDDNYSIEFSIRRQFESASLCGNTADSTFKYENGCALNDCFSYHELKRAIRGSKNSTPGQDRISYAMLQHLSRQSLNALLRLCNEIWRTGTFPQAWRHSIIVPVLKAGKDKQDLSSYRPISLTSTIGKIMEKLVKDRLMYYLEKNGILNNRQTGFRQGRSTTDQLIRLQDTINKYNLNRGYTAAVFIDFQSAYDMLWHDGLLVKLKKMGVTGEMYNYIKQFLSGRTIQVRVGKELSDIVENKNGTPQRSVISPLLFLIMINDLPECIKGSEVSLFADDSCLFKSGRRLDAITKSLQTDLNNLAEWCEKNGFKISMEKTVAVLFTHRKDNIHSTLKIKDTFIKVEDKARFLGLIFDSKLTWNDHVDYIIDKCKKRLNVMRAVAGNKWGASKKVLLIIYRSLIRSILDYGAIALDSMSNRNKERLDSVQAQALRIACGAARGTATAALQVEMGEPPLQIRRLQLQLQYAVKVKSLKDHPAKKVFEPHWTARNNKFDLNTEPIYYKVADFIATTEIIETEHVRPKTDPPWRRKQCHVDISIAKAGRKDENPNLLCTLAKEKIDTYKQCLHIFTDASKTSTGQTAASYCIPQLKVEHSCRLSDGITIFAGELAALHMALLWIKDNYERNTLQQDIVVFSDSLSCLTALKTGYSACRPKLLDDVLQTVNEIGLSILFVWIPSHLGLKGNELADRLAQAATRNAVVDTELNFEILEYKIKVKKFILEKWQTQWSTSLHGEFYRKVESRVSLEIKYEHGSRNKEVTLTRLRLGKCWVNEYLARIKAVYSDRCPLCKKSSETVEHFILLCPSSDLCKKVLSVCRQINVLPEIGQVLSNKKVLDEIYVNLSRKI